MKSTGVTDTWPAYFACVHRFAQRMVKLHSAHTLDRCAAWSKGQVARVEARVYFIAVRRGHFPVFSE